MWRFLWTLVLLVLVVISFLPGESVHAWQSSNLLENPGFEEGFRAWRGINEVQVAHGWTPWWRDRKESDPAAYYFKPEYNQASGWIHPERVRGGAAAQHWFTFHSSHLAGMYQQVFNVRRGTRYQFTIWAHVWSSSEDDPNVSRNPASPNMQVGIDPTGGWDWWAGTVIWSGTYAFYDNWGQLAVEATAQNDVITVFMRSEPNWPVKHNDFYWDDAALVVAGQPVQPPPTATSAGPSPPTVTSAATPEPTATCAPAPPDWVTYYVVKGDTLYSLSTRSGTKVERVKSVNCLSSTTIHVGQALLLPRQPDTRTPTTVPNTPIPVTPTQTQTPVPETPTATKAPTKTGTPTAVAPATPTRTPTATAPATPTQLPTATASATRTKAPTATKLPTVTASATPTRTPTEPPPTAAPATATSAPEVADTPTPTKPPPTIPPPPTSTPGSPTPRPTSTPAASGTRPCGTIYVGAGIVMLAGVFRFRRRGKQ